MISFNTGSQQLIQHAAQVIQFHKGPVFILLGIGISIFGAQKTRLAERASKMMKHLITIKKVEQPIMKEQLENMSEKEQQAQFKQIIAKYNKEFEDSKVMEQIVEKKIGPGSQIGKMSKKFSYAAQDYLQEDLQKALCDPIWEMLSRGGKRIRPIFCALIAESFGKQFKEVMEIAGFIEVLHNSSLIIDDIEDNSLMRREKTAVHLIYGVDVSINAGNYAYFAPFNYLLGLKKYDDTTIMSLTRVYAEEMTQIHFGQAWDLLWHNLSKNQMKFPTENQYIQMVVHKTGVLFRMMARMTSIVLGLSQEKEKSLSRFTEKIGAAFQIQDDIINIDSNDYKSKGIRGEDIYEGKITVIVLHCLERQTEAKRTRLIDILSQKTQDQTLINEAISLLQETGSVEYAKNLAEKLMKEAWEELNQSLPESNAKYFLKLICQFVTKRSQ